MSISDPFFSSQWHFNLIGDIQAIWDDYTGSGVAAVVYDDGVEQFHEDLDDNYDGSAHYLGIGSDDGQPNTNYDGHGTSVAGLIGAENNGVGGVGVAYDVTLTSVDFLEDIQYQGYSVYFDALRYAGNFDIMNNSWGSLGDYSLDIGDFGWSRSEKLAFDDVVADGRDGLGTIIVKAAGNDANDSDLEAIGLFGNANGEGMNNLHSTITVAATDQNGDAIYYSNWGTSILITAPAASVTTDLVGSGGYDSGDYTSGFGGTSAATPVVSGVVALMLQANPELGWRDVQNIFALSASHTGSGLGGSGTGYEVDDWFTTSVNNWNGGGTSFHLNYGFGMIDAFAAVRFAEIWSLINDDAQVSSNEVEAAVSYDGASQAIPDSSYAEMTISVTEGVRIEHIYVTVDLIHFSMEDVTIELIGPNGEVYVLSRREGGDNYYSDDWTFGVTGALGLSSIGDWTLRVSDGQNDGWTGTLNGFDIEFRGSALDNNTTYHFTDDFLSYASVENDRRLITESDGGVDWVNLAAITGNVVLSLTANGSLQVADTSWTTFVNGDEIENATLGDGDDLVTGGASRNELHGGRGSDTLNGADGEDVLHGDDGADLLNGGSDGDMLHGGRGEDTLYGATGSDTLIGSSGNDLISGEGSITELDAALAQVFRVFQATLDRTPGQAGHLEWAELIVRGTETLESVITGFVNSVEFQSLYGATSNSEFVTLLYNNVLDRAPDSAGLTSWSNALDNGSLTREQVVMGFSESREFQNNTLADSLGFSWAGYMTDLADSVFRVFQATLDRAPNLAGLTNWSGTLAEGMALEDVISGFVNSAEFQARYGATSNSDFVTLLFNNVLGRAPGAAGLANWTEALDSGALTREQVVKGFSESREFILNTQDDFNAYIVAQGADDRLEGGTGTNMLFGGWLSDTFAFNANLNSTNTVADLESWDYIELQNFSLADGAAAIAALTQVGEDVVLTGGGTTVTFANTTLSDFSEDMFLFV